MTKDGRYLQRLRWGSDVAALTKPYDLSFAQLNAFNVVWVLAEDSEGRIGIGEAVPLPGYNWETLESICGAVASICEAADGATVASVVGKCRDFHGDHPFAASAVMAALDMPQYLGYAGATSRFPISAPVSGHWPVAKLRHAVEAQISGGCKFVKVKVGRDFDSDAAAARTILTEWPSTSFSAVFDANQAHSTEQGLAFARVLQSCASERLQWYEQPVDRRDWEGMERLCRSVSIPIVLDECIYDEADIRRAAAIGAYGVKLKLVKNFGIAETISLGRLAQNLGLVVVFGNGVATEIGNLGEFLTLAAAGGLFAVPSESSGFAKLQQPILGRILDVSPDGHLVCCATTAEITERIGSFFQVDAG